MRVEEWLKDLHGMTSTVVVEVLDSDVVHVSDQIAEELSIPRDYEVVKTGINPHFVWEVPYETLADAIRKDGWVKRADSEE